MKRIAKIISAVCAVTLALTGASCHLEPYELPEDELFLRSFIKKYGLIDPDQEWNESKETVITVMLGDNTKNINILVANNEMFYRVAYFVDATGTVKIPVDIPKSSDILYVMVNDDVYTTGVGGTVDASKAPGARSRETVTNNAITNAQDLKWLLVAEDLGTTDDFDFNDIVVGISAVTLNENALQLAFASEQWEVIRNEEHLTLENVEPGSRGASRDGDKNYKMLQIYPLAAGGTLPLYLHYNNGSTDYILGGSSSSDAKNITSMLTESSATNYEWHRWFGDESGCLMINTGWNSDKGGATLSGTPVQIVVDESFSMTNYSRKYVDENNNNTSGPGSANGALKGDETKYPAEYENYYTGIFGFYITVSSYSKESAQRVIAAPLRGSAPHMFLIPDFSNHADGKWHWPIERVDITDVYPLFRNWVVDAANQSWYNDLGGSQGVDYYKRDNKF